MGPNRFAGALIALAAGLATFAVEASAAEVVAYKYDIRGRLVEVKRTGTVNNGVTTTYAFDKAHNRINKATTGSSNLPPP